MNLESVNFIFPSAAGKTNEEILGSVWRGLKPFFQWQHIKSLCWYS